MIGTDRFVYVHQPKTGGTFVTSVLFELGELLGAERLWGRATWFQPRKTPLKHGTCRNIPRSHRHLPVLSSVRHPLDLYVSEYEFGWWKRKQYSRWLKRRVRDFERRFPSYPDLSFEDFVRVFNEAFCTRRENRRFESGAGRGWLTERFVRFHFRRPASFLRRLSAGRVGAADTAAEMFPLTFIYTHDLNRELHRYLLGLGYPAEALDFIVDAERVLPGGKGRAPDDDWTAYYSDEFRDHVRRRERLLFELFPAFDD